MRDTYGSIPDHDFQALELYSVLEVKAIYLCLYLGNSSHLCIRLAFRLPVRDQHLAWRYMRNATLLGRDWSLPLCLLSVNSGLRFVVSL